MQNPAGWDVLTGETIEAGPVEPVPLASTQQCVPPCAAHFAAKAIQPKQVRWNCMIREVSLQDSLEPQANDGHRFVPPLVKLLANHGQRCSHSLQGCQSDYLKFPFSRGPTTMREPQKIERFGPALPPVAPSLDRIAAELNQARFIRMQGQPELCQPFLQIFQKQPRRCDLLKTHDTVIGIANHDDVSFSLWLFTPVLNPEIENVVQVDVRR